MFRIFIVCITITVCTSSMSAQSVTDQIDAVYQVQQKERLRQEQYQRILADQQARMAAQQRAERSRDRSYEDQLRALELEQKKLQLDRVRTHTTHQGEFIDRELKRIDAETDVIRSQAESYRNVSEGTKSFLSKAGDALNK